MDHRDKYLNIDWLRSTGVAPKFFGIGFIQIKLTPDERVHIWHPDLTPVSSFVEYHDHRYDFSSDVMIGTLSNYIYEFTPHESGDMICQRVSCDAHTPYTDPVPTIGTVSLLSRTDMSAGTQYTMAADTFHESYATRAVTRLTRHTPYKTFARVIRPRQADAVCPFSVEIPEAKLWEMIDDVLCAPDNPVAPPGYHLTAIPKGVLGEASKIVEEALEVADAAAQNASIMELVELSDLYGAMQAMLDTHHPGKTMADLANMAAITKRAFANGRR